VSTEGVFLLCEKGIPGISEPTPVYLNEDYSHAGVVRVRNVKGLSSGNPQPGARTLARISDVFSVDVSLPSDSQQNSTVAQLTVGGAVAGALIAGPVGALVGSWLGSRSGGTALPTGHLLVAAAIGTGREGGNIRKSVLSLYGSPEAVVFARMLLAGSE